MHPNAFHHFTWFVFISNEMFVKNTQFQENKIRNGQPGNNSIMDAGDDYLESSNE